MAVKNEFSLVSLFFQHFQPISLISTYCPDIAPIEYCRSSLCMYVILCPQIFQTLNLILIFLRSVTLFCILSLSLSKVVLYSHPWICYARPYNQSFIFDIHDLFVASLHYEVSCFSFFISKLSLPTATFSLSTVYFNFQFGLMCICIGQPCMFACRSTFFNTTIALQKLGFLDVVLYLL